MKENLDLPMDIMLAPTKSTVLVDKLPEKAPVTDEEFLLTRIKAELNKEINLIPLIPLFQSKNDEYIYYKTDHHYTSLGAYYAYREYMDQLGIKPYDLDFFKREAVTDDFLGSQFRQSNYYRGSSETIERFIAKKEVKLDIRKNGNEKEKFDSLYDEKFLDKADKYSFFLGGDDALIDIKTDIGGRGTLLLVKDSFANSLVPFLTLHFDRIIVIDERYFNISLKDYIRDMDIDRVLILKNIRNFYDG